jgi:hypothetical protein
MYNTVSGLLKNVQSLVLSFWVGGVLFAIDLFSVRCAINGKMRIYEKFHSYSKISLILQKIWATLVLLGTLNCIMWPTSEGRIVKRSYSDQSVRGYLTEVSDMNNKTNNFTSIE